MGEADRVIQVWPDRPSSSTIITSARNDLISCERLVAQSADESGRAQCQHELHWGVALPSSCSKGSVLFGAHPREGGHQGRSLALIGPDIATCAIQAPRRQPTCRRVTVTWGGPRVPLTGRRIVLVERTPQERSHWLHGDEHGSREGARWRASFQCL